MSVFEVVRGLPFFEEAQFMLSVSLEPDDIGPAS